MAGGAVAAGIIFESNEYSASTHRVAKWLVIIGVFVESVCTISLFVFDEGISSAQQSKLIALETYLAPRVLSTDQNALVIARLSDAVKSADVGPIQFAFTGTNEEEFLVAIRLADNVFAKLGWEWIDWPGPPTQVRTLLPSKGRVVGWIPMSGIQVQAVSPKLEGVEKALVSALQEIGLESVRSAQAMDAELQRTSHDEKIILIMIGAKPTTGLPVQ